MVEKKANYTGQGDWFRAKNGTDGTIIKEGKVAGCSGCHDNERDYIMTK